MLHICRPLLYIVTHNSYRPATMKPQQSTGTVQPINLWAVCAHLICARHHIAGTWVALKLAKVSFVGNKVWPLYVVWAFL